MQTLVDLEFLMAVTPADGRRAVLENLRVGADVIKVVADDPPRTIDEDTMKAIVTPAFRARSNFARSLAIHWSFCASISGNTAIDRGTGRISRGQSVGTSTMPF